MVSTILIVEDSPDDAELLEALLRANRVKNPVCRVASAAEAMAYLEGTLLYSDRDRFPLPRIVLLDLKMPGTDGFALLTWIKARREMADVLVVVVSALDDWKSIQRAYTLGTHSFLPKPCTSADLRGLIQGFPRYWCTDAAGGVVPPGSSAWPTPLL